MSPKVDPIGQMGSLLLLYFLPHHFDPQHPLSSLHFTACALLTASTIMFALFSVCSFLSPSKYWPLLSICCQLPAGPLHPNLRFSSLSSDLFWVMVLFLQPSYCSIHLSSSRLNKEHLPGRMGLHLTCSTLWRDLWKSTSLHLSEYINQFQSGAFSKFILTAK